MGSKGGYSRGTLGTFYTRWFYCLKLIQSFKKK